MRRRSRRGGGADKEQVSFFDSQEASVHIVDLRPGLPGYGGQWIGRSLEPGQMGELTVLQGIVSEGHQIKGIVGSGRSGEFGRPCVSGQVAVQPPGRRNVLRPCGILVPPSALLQELVPKIICRGGLNGTPVQGK